MRRRRKQTEPLHRTAETPTLGNLGTETWGKMARVPLVQSLLNPGLGVAFAA
jgi:hypothetical protein